MSRVVVVTGTGTGVGKSVATAWLATRATGRVVVVKPVQTGVGEDSDEVPDVDVVARLSGVAGRELVRLAEPLAPETAARRAGVTLPSVASHAAAVVELAATHDTVVVEGAGGLLVRLDSAGGTLLDLVVGLLDLGAAVEVVVVARSGLGTLNHAELTVGALRARGIEPAGIVVGSWPSEPDLAERCNLEDLPRVTDVPLLAVIPEGVGSLGPSAFRTAAPTWSPGRSTTGCR